MSSAIAQTNGTWAAVLAQALIACAQVDEASVVDVVLSPGSRSTPLVLAFEACPQARLHNVLDERAAAFFALGLARARRQPAILLCTSGSAGTHWYPAVVEAAGSRVPLLLLTADRPVELQDCGAPQTMNQQQLFGPHVRLFADLGAPRDAGGGSAPRFWQVRAAQAVDAATGAVPGPVHLNVAFREPLWAPGVHALAEVGPAPRVVRGAPQVDAASVAAFAARLQVERGVIVCGPRSPDDGGLAAAVTALAARLQWPILAEPTSGLRFGSHPKDCIVSTGDALLRDAVFAADHAPQCVLRIGAMPTSKPMTQWLGQQGAGRTILVEPSGQWLDPTLGVDTLLVAEPVALCRTLTEQLPARTHSAWLPAWREADESAGAALRHGCGEGFWGGAVVRELMEALPAGAGLHVASSMAVRDLDSFAPPRTSDVRVWCNRGTNGIDGTLACFLGAATAWQEDPAVALMGDLAFLHDVGALLLGNALRGQSATVVVVNNQGGSIFDFLPIAQHPSAFAPHFRTPQVATIGALCAAAEVRSARVISREGLRAALQESLARPGLDVIEAAVETHAQPRYAAAWQAVRTAMAMTT